MTTITQITQGDLGNTKSKSRYRKACFTLNNWTDEEYNTITQHFEKNGYLYIIGKELGEQEETPHLQGYVEFNKKTIYFTTLKKICNRAHWERANGNREQNITYCSKEGNFVSNFPPPIKSLKEQILEEDYSNIQWKPWQQEIIDLCETKPDKRTIHWYWEPTGNVGKSFLCKYLGLVHEPILASGKSNDIFNQILTWMNTHKEQSPRIVVCDIPRTNMEYLNYTALEQIKNGFIYSGKYEGGICCFKNPHVIIFANEEPNKRTMSLDRWNVKRIT